MSELSKKEYLAKLEAEVAADALELSDDVLDDVAGGRISEEDWYKLSPEERQKLALRSVLLKRQGYPCPIYDE